jgi:hypothetical protein
MNRGVKRLFMVPPDMLIELLPTRRAASRKNEGVQAQGDHPLIGSNGEN